jgi:hypothetical protein
MDDRLPIAERIATARLKACLSEQTVAERIGLSTASYYDLEAYDDEAFMSVSIAR